MQGTIGRFPGVGLMEWNGGASAVRAERVHVLNETTGPFGACSQRENGEGVLAFPLRATHGQRSSRFASLSMRHSIQVISAKKAALLG